MAFFDDLSKKTKNMADSAKYSSAIAEEEKKLNTIYYQIGKLYVSLHPADYEQEFGGMMSQIVDIESRLSGYRQQLQQIKGVSPCPKCGAEVARNSAFCPGCGSEMPKSEKGVELEKCVSCGNHVAKGLRFCTYCGKPMATQVVAPPPQQETIDFCPGCGRVVPSGIEFCSECGAKVC